MDAERIIQVRLMGRLDEKMERGREGISRPSGSGSLGAPKKKYSGLELGVLIPSPARGGLVDPLGDLLGL